MNITKIMAVSAGLILGTATLSAQGYGPGMGGGRMGGGRGPAMMAACGPQALNLTEAQQVGYKKILEAHQTSLAAKLKAADEARDAQRKVMHDPAVSDAKVKELHAKVSEAMTAVMLERRAMMREFEALLTPEQKNSLALQRLEGSMGMGKGGRRGSRGCGGCS
jgi:Spy/CpxP family protein refolding chaperone